MMIRYILCILLSITIFDFLSEFLILIGAKKIKYDKIGLVALIIGKIITKYFTVTDFYSAYIFEYIWYGLFLYGAFMILRELSKKIWMRIKRERRRKNA